MSIQVFHPPGEAEPRSLLARVRVRSHEVEDVGLANPDEVSTFAIQKRTDEHLSGRWLLHECLVKWGCDPSLLMVERTEHRAPYLTYISGVWKNTPLPSLSICHSDGWAYVALVEAGWRVGIDAEAKDRGIQLNAFDMMAKGEELEHLNHHPTDAIEAWVAKEAIQKVLGLGMHLNPRDIQIPIGVNDSIISIEKSKIQLKKWTHKEAKIALALAPGSHSRVTAEDSLLEATRAAMAEGEWGVGCNTMRNNV